MVATTDTTRAAGVVIVWLLRRDTRNDDREETGKKTSKAAERTKPVADWAGGGIPGNFPVAGGPLVVQMENNLVHIMYRVHIV